MDLDEVSELLALAALTDGRNVDDPVLEWWHELLAETDFLDAREVLKKHYRASTEYLMPVHIVQGVRELEAERFRLFGDLGYTPEVFAGMDLTDAQEVAAELRWKRERAELVRRGLAVKHPSTREVTILDDPRKALER
jgi:hypothetical protein